MSCVHLCCLGLGLVKPSLYDVPCPPTATGTLKLSSASIERSELVGHISLQKERRRLDVLEESGHLPQRPKHCSTCRWLSQHLPCLLPWRLADRLLSCLGRTLKAAKCTGALPLQDPFPSLEPAVAAASGQRDS